MTTETGKYLTAKYSKTYEDFINTEEGIKWKQEVKKRFPYLLDAGSFEDYLIDFHQEEL